MDMSFEEKVRERAYQIWMSAGMGDGMAHEHWLTAETAVRNETAVPAAKAVRRADAGAAMATMPKVKTVKAKSSTKASAKPRAKKATH